MRRLAFTLGIVATGACSAAQLSVTAHELAGSYAVSAFAGSAAGGFNVSEPDGYLRVISEATLINEAGDESANFFGVLQSTSTDAGFRVAGFVDADRPVVPFYQQSHDLLATVRFELASATPIRITGTLAHNPSTSGDAIALLNGTGIELRDAGSGAPIFSERVSPIGGSASRAIDAVVVLPAGSYAAELASFSRMGAPLSPGLLDVKVSWDLSLAVVPPPATIAVAPVALLAMRRRR